MLPPNCARKHQYEFGTIIFNKYLYILDKIFYVAIKVSRDIFNKYLGIMILLKICAHIFT